MRIPWTARRSKQSVQKKVNLEYSLEGLILKVKFQYFGHLMQRADSLEKTLMLGKIEGRRRRGRQRMRWLDSITDSKNESEQTLGDSGGEGNLEIHKENEYTLAFLGPFYWLDRCSRTF